MQKKSINRYRSFCRSLDNLADAGLADADNKFVLSGTVQMFHLSFELSWKITAIRLDHRLCRWSG